MKMKSLGLVLLTIAVTDSCIHAARRPSKVGQPARVESKESHEKLRHLLTEIAGANVVQVKSLLEDNEIKKALNKHDGTFSPLGKVDDELEKNKRSSLAKNEKMARGKALTKIRQLLEEHGATMIFRSADVAEPVKKKRAKCVNPPIKEA